MALLDLCEKYYNTRNLYEVLQISEESTDKEVKKAYHKLSLKVHPDRVGENDKLEATEKFKVLGSIHAILGDKNKRAIYDETKSIDEEDYKTYFGKDWGAYWRMLFRKITDEDIIAYELEYMGSTEEREDLKNAYLAGKGDMDYIVDQVQFARSEHEPRLKAILNAMIEKGEIPAFEVFTHEPEEKRLKRIARENREAKQAEELQAQLGLKKGTDNLESLIKRKQQARQQQSDDFLNDLAEKYVRDLARKATKRKATLKKASTTNEPARRASKRKAAPKEDSTTKNKKRK